jgi:hypothetical protein
LAEVNDEIEIEAEAADDAASEAYAAAVAPDTVRLQMADLVVLAEAAAEVAALSITLIGKLLLIHAIVFARKNEIVSVGYD